MKNFGYLICINESDTTNFSKLAYALALSIKNSQREGFDNVSLITNDKKSIEKYKSLWIFDNIIEFDKEVDGWDIRSYMDEYTPYDYTVCLDADMLFLRDYSHWIEYFIENNIELYIPHKAFTYRGDVVESSPYRKCFVQNQLPNLYSFYTFFVKNSNTATEFFNLQRQIIQNQEIYSNNFLSKYKPKIIGTDEAFALAAKILDIGNDISFELEFPRVVHLKGGTQNWPWPADTATDHVGFYFNKNAELKIGSYQQNDIVHYVEKDKVTFETVNVLEELLWKK